MAKLISISEGDGAELPEVQCSECDVIFSVVWNNNGYTTGVEYCPFCGVEFDSSEVKSW